jgi:serine/threonine-protein kinase
MTKAGSVELTTGMQIGGTPLYMAPERVTSPKRLDARLDNYSLGAVAYYLQTGRPIFETTNDQELIHKIMNDLPMRPSKICPQAVPPELENLIMDCLAKNPEDRPQSVFAILERLEELSGLGTWTQEDATDWWEHHNVAHKRCQACQAHYSAVAAL